MDKRSVIEAFRRVLSRRDEHIRTNLVRMRAIQFLVYTVNDGRGYILFLGRHPERILPLLRYSHMDWVQLYFVKSFERYPEGPLQICCATSNTTIPPLFGFR